ncbi:MAG: hypothetical protein FWD69_16650 [Polyangiaceae bacterium]|nr:hypothetical protein [Polyangiaceae bacterium]
MKPSRHSEAPKLRGNNHSLGMIVWNGVYAIAHSDVLATLRELPSNEFDGLLCDPPYGLCFQAKTWDYNVPPYHVWHEALRVLKPGAPLLAFGGPRTFHRIASIVEDVGFELRDCFMWLFGSGFPKSQNVSLALDKEASTAPLSTKEKGGTHDVLAMPATPLARIWDGYSTTLKPAYEPIVLARKPLEGNLAQNVARWGVGGLAIDACRIGDRWPANLILDEGAGALLDASVAPTHSVSGGPSRFFYCAKVSTKEREFGCEALPKRIASDLFRRKTGSAGIEHPRAGAGRGSGAHNHHPTLKPIGLTRWLATLIKPPSDTAQLLVPYCGTGSEMIGALQAGWSIVFGIERNAEYVQIAHARLGVWGEKR